jgi:hypothetical protein
MGALDLTSWLTPATHFIDDRIGAALGTDDGTGTGAGVLTGVDAVLKHSTLEAIVFPTCELTSIEFMVMAGAKRDGTGNQWPDLGKDRQAHTRTHK